MKLVIKKQSLLKMLNIAMDAIPSKSTEACFLNFLLTITDEGCNILASDGKITIKVNQFNKDTDGNEVILDSQEGSIQLPAKLSREIIAKVAGEVITLEQVDSSLLTISDDRTTYNINTKPGNEYPDIELGTHVGEEIELSPEDFKTLYDATYFAVAQKSNRDMFLGINIKCFDHKISFTASDTCRLARKTLPLQSNVMVSFNCSLKVLSVINKLEHLPVVRIRVGADKVSFTVGSVTISAKTIPGEFPEAEKILPSVYPYKLKCSSKELVDILDRVCIVSGDDKSIIKNAKLVYDGSKVEISSRSPSYGYSVERLDNCEFEGDKFTIYFNADFVKDACKAHTSDDITILFSGEVRMFRVVSSDESNLQLITPVRYYQN